MHTPLGDILDSFTVGTERHKIIAPLQPDLNMIKPLRNMDSKSVSLKAKCEGMGNSEVSNRVLIEHTEKSPVLFNTDWFDIWLSLKSLVDFDIEECDTVGFKLL